MTNETKIRFWAGLRTIGGTIVTIEYGRARIVFDFGTPFLGASPLADHEVRKREPKLVHDYLKLGILPEIGGLYAGHELPWGMNLVPAERSDLETAVFISHLHLDHMSVMGLVAPSIPVYLSEESAKLYASLNEIGEGVPGNRDYQSMALHKPVRVGEIEVTALPMDHCVPGACGFHIRTPDGCVFYTGDLRFHGFDLELTKQSLSTAKAMGLDALIIEGTMLWEPDADGSMGELTGDLVLPEATELTLPSRIAAALQGSEGLAVFNVYHRNIGRLRTMVQAAREAGRTLVLEPATAYLLYKHTGLTDALVYASSGFLRQLQEEKLYDWQTTVLQQFKRISADEINLSPSGYFVQNEYRHLLELLDLNTGGGLFIHSDGTPLGSYDPSYERLLQFVERAGMSFESHRVSGHASARHLKWTVDYLDPAVLIPLHSFYPERLQPLNGVRLLPESGQTYVLKNRSLLAVQTTDFSD